jgi:hypothetical protein
MTAPVPWARRVGHLLELGGADAQAGYLSAYGRDAGEVAAPQSSATGVHAGGHPHAPTPC